MEIDGKETNPNADTLQELATINSGQAPDPSPEMEASAAESQENNSEPAEGEQAPSVTPESQVIYDGQSFASEKEALDYMKDKAAKNETDLLVAQARQEAYESALGSMSHTQQAQAQAPAQQAKVESQVPFDEAKYFEDPAGYMKQYNAEVSKQLSKNIKDELRHEINSERQEQALWDQFFKAHPDLDGFKDMCELELNQHRDTIGLLARKDQKKAMDFLATKTRERFQTWQQRTLPQQELPNNAGGPSMGSGGGVTPSAPKNEHNPIDLVTQMRNMWT